MVGGLLGGGGGGPLSAVGGITGGDGPLSAASGLTGNGGPLNAVSGLTGGEGGPLEAVSSLTGGGGDAGPLGAVSGLTSGLLGGSQGLNLLGLVAIGSDEDAAIDLSPAEKKKVKAQKEAIKAQNDKKREAAMQALREQVKKQGHPATEEQKALAQQLNDSQVADQKAIDQFDEVVAQSESGGYGGSGAAGGQASGPSQGLFYAYLVDSESYQPTHVLTFANAAEADQWYQSNAGSLDKTSDQMYKYSGVPPRPSGKMSWMPINTVQPMIPLQRGDGYPICCKSGPAAPAAPTRKKLSFQEAGRMYAAAAKQKGDPRPKEVIAQEAMQDLKEACAAQHATSKPAVNNASASYGAPGVTAATPPNGIQAAAPSASNGGPLGGLTGGGGPLGGLTGGGGPLGGLTGGGGPLDALGGGDLLGSLLGSGEGLNVLGLLAIGSDEKAALDLNPAQKKEVKAENARKLKRQTEIQDAQAKALREAIAKNNGKPTPEQAVQQKELEARQNALQEAIKKFDERNKADETKKQAQSQSALPTDGLTQNLPVNGVTKDLPVNGVASSLPTKGLPLGGL